MAEVPPAAAVAERLRSFGVDLAAHAVAVKGAGIEDSLLRLNPEALFPCAPQTFADIDRLRTLAARLRCPVVLVRRGADGDRRCD